MEGQFQILFDSMKIEMQTLMQTQTVELKESITNSIMDKMEEKLIPLVEENKELKLKIGKLENEIEFLKRGEKKNNVIVFGLEEKETSAYELIQELKKNLKQDLNINLEHYEINKIHRIGTKNEESNKSRPVLCSFVNNWKKNEILKNRKNLKTINISEDYSKEVLEKRRKLKAELFEERKNGKIAYLKYDKLIVKENKNSQDKRKRESSASPSSYNTQTKKYQTVSSIKSNRTNAFDVMRSRSNSFSNVTTKKQ
ncbi:uncharacterized protein LOC128199165 [Bicyclus anynana]|uniref:Uncharacterized protein LOC128198421 n=1 Tax=Bicyclus anynana TaxID=110368 RepID=A0ABM3LWC6_BICAN|nr:uncharacterized protein LOC128198421 [Bicyclus anynana]XP_052743380.1 uncharacterized protein LOC128199165 [Bicyclus anynana]